MKTNSLVMLCTGLLLTGCVTAPKHASEANAEIRKGFIDAETEERVLALLSRLSQVSSYYADTIFESVKPPLGAGPVLVPRVAMVMCADVVSSRIRRAVI